VLLWYHSGAIGRITVGLWISQAAAHLPNGSCRFCLCNEKLAVPIPDIFFFPRVTHKQCRNYFLQDVEKQRVKEPRERGEGGDGLGECLCYSKR